MGGVVQEQGGTLRAVMLLLLPIFVLGFVGQETVSPNLSVGMGIVAAHCGAFVLEHLYPGIGLTQFRALHTPGGDHDLKRRQRQLRQRFIVVRIEVDHLAGIGGALALQQRIIARRRWEYTA